MKILVVTVARFGNEKNVLQLFGDQKYGAGAKEFAPEMPLDEFVNIIARLSGDVDFICVDECALGSVVLDYLGKMGVRNILQSHRLRSLGVGQPSRPDVAWIKGYLDRGVTE